MKLNFLFPLIFLLLAGFTGQAQSSELVGTWRVHLAKTVELMDGSWKERYDTLSVAVKNRANQSMQGREFRFKSNGEVEVRWTVNEIQKLASGSWKEEDDGKLLIITMHNKPTEYALTWTPQTALVLRNPTGNGLFNNLYLEKVD